MEAAKVWLRDAMRDPVSEPVSVASPEEAGGGGGGGGFTPFSDDFSGDLSQWTEVGSGGIVSGVWRVTNTSAALWRNGVIPATGAGSWDFKVTVSRTGSFEHQICFLADETMQGNDLPVQDNTGNGYVVRISSSVVVLYEIGTGGSLGSQQIGTGTIASGSVVTVRITRNDAGDISITVFDDGVRKAAAITILAGNLVAVGTGIGVASFAGAGQNTDIDDVSFDAVPVPSGHELIGTFNAVASYSSSVTNMDITNILNGPLADGDMLYNTATGEYVFMNDIHEGSGTIIFTMTRAQLGTAAAAIEAAHLWNFYRPV